ncbi:MAG: glycosyltransferase [Patescibacteria group bacterium]|nr:glycosyltransferase [Patescibacteria group bacterium]
MKSRLKISVGIPAYNEEANIKRLLHSLLRQKETYGLIDEIIVISDGSTDKTVNEAQSINDKRIRVISRRDRRGMNATQNEIVSQVKGDILILLNADVLPRDNSLFDQLLKPFLSISGIGIVGGNTIPVSQPSSFVEWALRIGHDFKYHLYLQLNNTQTLYLCHGRVRAFSKEFYRKIQWPEDCPEDAYSFLRCKELGFRFFFSKEAIVYFRLPQTISDHAQQSLRFFTGKKYLYSYFSQPYVDNEYYIPLYVFFRTLVWYSIHHPIGIIAYAVISMITQLFYRKDIDITRWNISSTSKQIV